jgi:hypothetical protein
MADLLIRFVLGGAIVSAFAAIAELFEPKTFSGLFGAAPSVAIATLALTYGKLGPSATATSARWMLAGTIALFVYVTCCIWMCRWHRVSVWLGAAGSWLAWGGTACVVWYAVERAVQT